MRYSAFEQAAAEASLGMREVETQMEQLKSQIEQLKSKRDLLDTLSRQLLSVRPIGGDAAPTENPKEPAVEAPASEPARYGAPDVEAEMAGAFSSARSLREEWFSRSSDSGVRGPSSDSNLRGRL